MKKGILGKKLGMTQVFTKSGKLIPVTVVAVEPNVVTQVKTEETDGYNAIQLGFDDKREKLANKPEQGHIKKANTAPKRFFREIRDINPEEYTLGQKVTAEIFTPGEMVDATGISKGKGFQGVIKRHNFSRGPMTRGSHFHRSVGSLGSMQIKRVFKGKKMPGHMGAEQVTMQNLEVVMVDPDNNVMLIKGNVPGPKKSLIMIRSAQKQIKDNAEFEGLHFYEKITKQEETEAVEEEVAEAETTEEETETEEVTEAETTEEETETEEAAEAETTEEETTEKTAEESDDSIAAVEQEEKNE